MISQYYASKLILLIKKINVQVEVVSRCRLQQTKVPPGTTHDTIKKKVLEYRKCYYFELISANLLKMQQRHGYIDVIDTG